VSIFEQLKQIIVEQLDLNPDQAAKVTMEAKFRGDLNVDSLDMVEIIMEVEDKSKITIEDEDAGKITTVKDAVEYIEKHTQGG
jgi:acyl carrier protein